MKLNKLELYNFGPYVDRQVLDFPQDRIRNVMVVFGDNMRGKTSLLNSFRWVLYGKAINRYGAEIDVLNLLNTEAQKSGNFSMWVSLHFEHDGTEYELRRDVEPLPLVYQPKSGRDLSVRVLLRRNGELVPSDQIEPFVEQVLPTQISRFYLFDGELLQEYENLVMEESEQGRRIKVAIEQVLGVPALINARNDAMTLLKRAQQSQAQEFKSQQRYEQFANTSLQLQSELAVHEAELETANANLQTIKTSIKMLDEELANTQEVQGVAAEISAKRDVLRGHQLREKQLMEERLSVIKGAWRDLLQPRLEVRREYILSKNREHNERLQEIGALNAEASNLETLMHQDTCPLCRQDVSETQRHLFTHHFGEIKAKLDLYREEATSIAPLSEELGVLSRLVGTGAASRLKSVESEMKKLTIEITALESEIETLEERIRGHKLSSIAEKQGRRDTYVKALGQAEQKIKDINRLVAEKQQKLNQITSVLSADTAKTTATRQVEIYKDLVDVFSKSIEALRESLRQKIADFASEAFRELTTEKTYKGLRINEGYGLTILDQHEQPVSMRSAGAEQVVAMSLLSALNRAANRMGPVIIDTPFGRLDPKHRENILRHLPNTSEQIVLLVHAGELDPEVGIRPIADRIGAQYEIRRVSSAHSNLSKVVG